MFSGEPWMDDHARSQPRRRVLFVSTLITPAGQIKCKVRDLSVNGALVESDRKLAIGDQLDIEIPKIGPQSAEVTWANNFRAGLMFKSMLDPFQLKEMLEEKPRHVEAEITGAPRWERPKPVVTEDARGRSRDAVAWLRQQKLAGQKK
jgi:hypothetical protein